MDAPTSLIGMVDDTQYGTIVADVYEHIPELYYPNSVPVFAEMRQDSRLAAVVDGYGLQIRRAQWQVDGSGCRPEVTQFIADCLGLNVAGDDTPSGFRRRGVSWNDHLLSALLCQVFGHYAFEMEAEIDADGRARLAVLAERIPATISNIHADPKTGGLLGIDQQVTSSRQRSPQIPADRLVFYSRKREGASWQGMSLLRPAYRPWLIKAEMMRVAAIANRRWGAGVPVLEALPGTNPSPEQMAAAQRLASAARAGDQAGAATPPGFTMKIVGLSGSIPDTPGFIRLLNQEMSGSVLMPHLDLGTSETGARALGESFIDSWTLALEAEAEAIADTITRQCAVRIVDWNWGEDEPVPRIVVSGIGSRREITAESLEQLLAAGALDADPKLKAWVRREYRLPEVDPNWEPPLPAGAPARVPNQPPVEEDPAGVEEDTDDPEGFFASAGSVEAARWESRKHPRDRDGKFSRTPGISAPFDAKATHAHLVDGKTVTVSPAQVDAVMNQSAGGPIYNLNRLRVTGTENRNIFGRHARDIPRADMPQLSRQDGSLDAFNRLLAEQGITVRRESVDPRTLVATQNQLEGVKVSRLYERLKADGWPAGSAMFVARDGAVLDGHHRWAAAAAVSVVKPLNVTVLRVDVGIDDLLEMAHSVSAPARGMDDVAAAEPFMQGVTEIVTDTDDGVPATLFDEPSDVKARRDNFDPHQKRDRHGRWSRTGGGSSSLTKPGDGSRSGGGSGGSSGGGSGGKSGGGDNYGPMSDAEFEARQKMIADTIDKARKTLSTDITHTTADGAWIPERERLHREIAAELYAKADNVPRDGKAVIAGGLGGAGKSTVLRDHAGIDQSQYLTLNPDDVKELMAERGLIPEVPDHPDLSPMERAALVHEESSRITKLVANMAYRDRRNVIWDITMSSEDGVVSRLTDLDRYGYSARGVFVDIPVEVSVERALTRYRRGQDKFRAGKGLGGRFVPPKVIRAQKTSSGATLNREVFDQLSGRFADWSVYDNSVTGRAPQLVAEGAGTATATG